MAEENGSVVQSFFKTFSGTDCSQKEIEDFATRVLSYIEGQKWVRRPFIISPAVCSQYGWKCINSCLLECVTCGAKLCTSEPPIEIDNTYKTCIEKTMKDLKLGHKTHCPWPLAPLPESFVKMSSMSKEESLKHFMQRLQSSLEAWNTFPQIKKDVLCQLGLTDNHVNSLCKLAEITEDDIQLFGASLVCIAATGWALKSKGSKELRIYITCENCQRSIWSGAYDMVANIKEETHSEETDTENGSNDQNTSEIPSKHKRLKKGEFNPLEEHRPWCLWIATESNKYNYSSKGESPTNQDDSNSQCLPGWKIFIKSLLRNVAEAPATESETTPSKEHVRSVRNLLGTWTEPVH